MKTLMVRVCVAVLLGITSAAYYSSEAVARGTTEDQTSHSFTIDSEDNLVAGEVIVAKGSAPKVAIIVAGGSGANTRDDLRNAVPLFLNQANAVVLVDRRGNGASTGSFERPNTENSAWQIPAIGSDTADVASYLKTIGFEFVGVAGSSMGGWIAASAAAQSSDIDFLIAIVGGVVAVETSDRFDHATDQGMNIPDAMEFAQESRSGTGYDPLEDLLTLKQKGLWVFGEADTSNPSALDVIRLDRLAKAGQDFRYVLLPQTDHNLVNMETGQFNGSWVPLMQSFIAEATKNDGKQ